MKIAFTGMDLPEGKIKYHDEYLVALQEKDRPRKVAPFFAELFRDEFNRCDAIVLPKDKLLDLLILDMEKMESRLSRVGEAHEKKLVENVCKYWIRKFRFVMQDSAKRKKDSSVPSLPSVSSRSYSWKAVKASTLSSSQPWKRRTLCFSTPRHRMKRMPGWSKRTPTSSTAPPKFTATWPGDLLKESWLHSKII